MLTNTWMSACNRFTIFVFAAAINALILINKVLVQGADSTFEFTNSRIFWRISSLI